MKRYFARIKYARLDGSMNPKRRSEIAHDFNTQSNINSNNDFFKAPAHCLTTTNITSIRSSQLTFYDS